MDKIVIYLIVSIIGVPIIAFFVARFVSSYKREVAMYEWSSAEVKRRGEAIHQIEKRFKDSAGTIAKLQAEIGKLTEEVEAYKKKYGDMGGPKPDAAGKAAPAKPGAAPGTPGSVAPIRFDVGVFNQEVRDYVAQNKAHKEFSNNWAEINYIPVDAKNEAEARAQLEKRYPKAKGFVIASIKATKEYG